LHACRKKYPKAKLVGVEYSFLPYLLGQIQNSFLKDKLILKKENLFKVNLKEANVIYCYLNPGMMRKLEDKFRQECQADTVIISYAFPLPNMTSEKEIEISKHEKIYFYRI